jgi:dihydroxyacetone kinase DhaKLM complex PTS-EIIA-like component DhaM
MALYAKDITQSVEPAQANVATLGKGIEARAEGARLSANVTSTMLKAAGYVAEQYVAYDIGKTQVAAEEVTSEMLDKGMRAEKAVQDLPLVTAERDKLASMGTSYSVVPDAGMRKQAALGTYDQEIKRLKDAAAGGMSNEEYVSRVSALTRKAIAKYPGLADSIREKVGTITGLPYADRWAEMQYVRERFTKQQVDTEAMSPDKMAYKDIDKIAELGTFGNREELFTLYKKDRPQYDIRMKAANEHLATKTGVETLTKGISGLQAQSDFDADKLRGSFVAMFQGTLGINVTSASVSSLENIYKPTLAAMAKGQNININPAAFDVQIKMHNAQMKTNIEQARIVSINEIDKYLANNPNITSSKRDQMKADINSAADLQLKMYADDKGVGLAAMSAIMSNYRDKTLKEKRDLITLAIQQQGAMQNNSLVMAYWAGGPQRENLARTHPDFYGFMTSQEGILLSNSQGITSSTLGASALANVTRIIEAAGKSPEAVVLDPNISSADTKAALDALTSNANNALEVGSKGQVLSPVEKNIISSALSTNVQTGANSQILASDYRNIGAKIKLLPEADQATIKENVSKAASKSVMAMSSLKEGLENKHGTVLKLGYLPNGQIVAMQTPLTPKEMSAVKNGVPLSEARRQAAAKEEAAVIEFNKQSKPILSNLVFSRAMLTDENPTVIANEFALMLNNKQTYTGFSDNKPVAPVDAAALAAKGERGNAEMKRIIEAEEAAKAKLLESKRMVEGKRSDGTVQGDGYFGKLTASDGSTLSHVSTTSSKVKVNNKEIEFPLLVPTLTKEEVNTLINDIVPNNKYVPDAIFNKAVDHANKRIKAGRSVFAEAGDNKSATVEPNKADTATSNNLRGASDSLIDDTRRPDGTPKGNGYLGVLKASDGSDVTELTTSSSDVKVNGKEIGFPIIVPTLTESEVNLLLTDIIPNKKKNIPDSIMKKAIEHAKKRIKEGKSVYAENTGEYTPNITPAIAQPVTNRAPPAASTTKKWWQ